VSKTQPVFFEKYLTEIDKYLKEVEFLQKEAFFPLIF